MLNVICLMGRLTAAPELKKTQNGVSVCSFTVACERSYVAAGQQRGTDFINVVAWRGTAEFVARYFVKGQLIAVDGSLQARGYEDKSGQHRTVYEVAADNVHFAGPKPGQGQQPAGREPVESDFYPIDESEDLPF